MKTILGATVKSEALLGMQQVVTSTHFYERARHYRFAAAVTDNKRDVEMFCDLGAMFEALARDFQRAETNRR